MKAIYYLTISVFLICLVAIVVKLTFWPVCTVGSACDGWTIAGLVESILGLCAVFLGILGAIAVAAWWTGLDKRVEDRVTQLFTERVQAVQASINQLNGQADDLRAKVDAIEETMPVLEQRITIAQQSAQTALEETLPPYVKQLRVHNQRTQKAADQQEQSHYARQFLH